MSVSPIRERDVHHIGSRLMPHPIGIAFFHLTEIGQPKQANHPLGYATERCAVSQMAIASTLLLPSLREDRLTGVFIEEIGGVNNAVAISELSSFFFIVELDFYFHRITVL